MPPRVIIALLVVLAAPALAQDFVRQSIPHKWLETLLPENLPELKYPAYYKDLDKARMQVFRGRYKLALLTLRKVSDKDGKPAEIALLRAQALAATGQREAAIQALSDAAVAADPRVQILRAQVLAELGRDQEAIALLREHLAKNPSSLAGHYHLGVIAERIGDLKTAREAYGWFDAEPQSYLNKWLARPQDFENAEEAVLIGRAYDRWASLNGQYKDNRKLHDHILSFFVKAYDVIDRDYWPARVAAAEYFLSHDNTDEATKELRFARAANPNDARTIDLMGQIALERFNFDGAEQAVAALRSVDPGSVAADLLETRNLLHQRRPKEAEYPVRRVLARHADHLEALGLLASVHALKLEEQKMLAVLQQVEKLDPDNASVYLEVAEHLAGMRQYPRSAAMYKIAIERAPWWTAARNGLGLLYTQSGDEDDAYKVLEAARALDPFNLRTTNYLRLLDIMAGMARKETTNFIILYDAQQDPMIPEYFAEYLESIHVEVCAAFKTKLPVKTLIEVFPTHDAFSVRTTGSPWIGTVGASTGRVIAMVSPRRGSRTMGTYNWAQVLRHEYTHTVTLAATDNRIAHWMTEGLAVQEERVPVRWEWVPMLYNAVTKKQLFTMENLTWGFVRPRRPMDRQLAYAQSWWVCQFIEEKWGRQALLDMMAQFRAGKPQEEVFPAVLKTDLKQFTADFFAWADRQVAGWGYDADTTRKYNDLRKKGEDLIKQKKYAEAVEAWEQIVKLRPVDALPHARLAGLYLTSTVNQPQKALEHLVRLHQVELKSNMYAKKIARLHRDAGRLDEATRYALQSVYIDPYDMDAHELLAGIYEKAGNLGGLEREKRLIPVLAKWIEENRQKLVMPPEGGPPN